MSTRNHFRKTCKAFFQISPGDVDAQSLKPLKHTNTQSSHTSLSSKKTGKPFIWDCYQCGDQRARKRKRRPSENRWATKNNLHSDENEDTDDDNDKNVMYKFDNLMHNEVRFHCFEFCTGKSFRLLWEEGRASSKGSNQCMARSDC